MRQEIARFHQSFPFRRRDFRICLVLHSHPESFRFVAMARVAFRPLPRSLFCIPCGQFVVSDALAASRRDLERGGRACRFGGMDATICRAVVRVGGLDLRGKQCRSDLPGLQRAFRGKGNRIRRIGLGRPPCPSGFMAEFPPKNARRGFLSRTGGFCVRVGECRMGFEWGLIGSRRLPPVQGLRRSRAISGFIPIICRM